MKEQRLIRIKKPKLRKVRNNFRELIIAACSKQKSKIIKRQNELIGTGQSNLELESEDDWWAIERPLRASICMCPSCFKSKLDMIYNPVLKEWFCFKCYNLNKEFKTSRLYP